MNAEIGSSSPVCDFIKHQAELAGFDKCAVTSTLNLSSSDRAAGYQSSISKGFNGTMKYLERTAIHRFNANTLLKGARTAVCLAVSYADKNQPPRSNEYIWIARYAMRVDYHVVLYDRLAELLSRIQSRFPDVRGVCCVDDKPIAEKAFAEFTGLGFIGKNTLLITPEFGSYVLLGELILDKSVDEMQTVLTNNESIQKEPVIEKQYDSEQSLEANNCGSCTKCIDACPTKAITKPYILDANKCISYLNKDTKLPVPPELANRMGNWVFGCDICQEVCPYNQKSFKSGMNSISVTIDMDLLKKDSLVRALCDNKTENLHPSSKRFEAIFGTTPVSEMGAQRFVKNLARIVSF